MNNFSKSASDSNYHSRHARRTLQRAEKIAEHMKPSSRILDVGCNNGITSQYLLDTGKASHVTGIELHASTVDHSLRETEQFDLLEGNVLELDLQNRYDAIIYGAVHHHILNFHGLTAAVGTLRKLVSHCDGSLFFETGQVGEGGRWRWQRAARRYFRTDEEHFFYLLRSIEQEIDGFEIIGKFWIHGIRRSYLKIDMAKSESGIERPQVGKIYDWPTEITGPFVRTFGSRGQSLLHQSDSNENDSPSIFWTSSDGGGQFLKQHRHLPIAATCEALIGDQVDFDSAVKPLGFTRDPQALVFPWIADAVAVTDFASAELATRRSLATQVLAIFVAAKHEKIIVEHKVLLPSDRSLSLTDVCDLHANNLLVSLVNGNHVVRLIDFEQQGTHYAYRNRMHLARILWSLKRHRFLAVSSYLAGLIIGLGWLIRFQTISFENRIRARQPNLLSVFIAETRSATGRAFGAALALIGLGEK